MKQSAGVQYPLIRLPERKEISGPAALRCRGVSRKEQTMKKIINSPENLIDEMLSGHLKAYKNFYEKVPGVNAYTYRNRRQGKTAVITGGGSGHEPMFGGFVGRGLADAVACGNIFAAPNPKLIFETAKFVDSKNGVLFVYGNYSGDSLNFDMAEELCEMAGIETAHVRIWDDCISAPKDRQEDRRGIAGNVFALKIAGAACDAGLSLREAARVVEKARDQICSAGLATSSAVIPGLEKPTFLLGENEIEFGMGIHGEPGIERTVMQPAASLTGRLYEEIKKDMDLKEGEEVAVLVNGLGSTTILELDIVYNDLSVLLERDGVLVYDAEIKTLCTCQEMGGFSISLFRLDDELKKYYDAPCYSPYYAKEGKRGCGM